MLEVAEPANCRCPVERSNEEGTRNGGQEGLGLCTTERPSRVPGLLCYSYRIFRSEHQNSAERVEKNTDLVSMKSRVWTDLSMVAPELA
jgi:hypothetical protein